MHITKGGFSHHEYRRQKTPLSSLDTIRTITEVNEHKNLYEINCTSNKKKLKYTNCLHL